MTGVLTLYRTSIGKKAIMALSGFVLVGFVVFHMYGNLKMYQGADVFNHYAAGLREIAYPIMGYEHLLWLARGILLASVFLHIWSATSLTLQSRQSTSGTGVSATSRYDTHKKLSNCYAAYTMRFGGVVILAFIIYHILHLTLGVVGYAPGGFEHPHNREFFAYQNVVAGFQNPFIVVFYSIATIFLGLHLYHGVWSMFQTLGLNNRKWTPFFRGLAIVIALVVVAGSVLAASLVAIVGLIAKIVDRSMGGRPA